MTVTLTAEQEKFIAERLRRGEYPSAEIIVSEGLKLVQAKEEHEKQLARLRAEINLGLEDIKRGNVLDGREVFARLLEKNRQRPRSQ
jgi:antitoxin ParD1/3/4